MGPNLGCRLGRCDDGWMRTRRIGREPRDSCDVLIPILPEKCDRVGEAGVPISASVTHTIPDREAEQHGVTRRFGIKWIQPLCRRQISRRIRRCQENDGPPVFGQARGHTPSALDVRRDGLQSAPFLIINMDGTDGSELPGPGAPWLVETEARRTGAIHWRR